MAVEGQQGGDSYSHFGRQPNPDTLLDNIQKLRRVKRAFVEHSLEPTGEQRQSESIRGSVFPGKSQSGKLGGTGRIVTEVFRNNMLEYIQGILNADPATVSTDVAKTTVYDGEVTPVSGGATETTVTAITSGTAAADEILITQPTTPSRLKITLADATGEVEIVGKRKYGLGSRDQVQITETVDLDDTTFTGLTDKYFDEFDKITFDHTGLTAGAATDLDIIGEPNLRKTVFKARSSVFDGWSFQSQIGKESRIGLTAVPSSAQFNVSDTVRLTIDMLLRAVYRRRTIENGVFEESLSDESDLVNDTFGDSEFFTDYGGYLLFDGDPIIFDSFDMTFNPGLQYRTGKDGSRIQAGIERGDAGAEVTGNIVVNFETGDAATDTFIKWDERYRDNILSEVELFVYFWTDIGKEYYHRIKLNNVELTQVPETPVSSRGAIKENLGIRAVVDNDEDILEWEIVDDQGWYGILPVLTRTGAATLDHSTATTVTIKFTGDATNFDTDDVTVKNVASDGTESDGTKGTFTEVADDEYTVEATTPVSGSGNMVVTIAENGADEGNPERSIEIPYA